MENVMKNFPCEMCHECHRAEWDSCFLVSNFIYPWLAKEGEKKK